VIAAGGLPMNGETVHDMARTRLGRAAGAVTHGSGVRRPDGEISLGQGLQRPDPPGNPDRIPCVTSMCLAVCSCSSGTLAAGAIPNVVLTDSSHFGSGNTPNYPRSVVDVNGDGFPDIVGFQSAGVVVALNKGSLSGSWLGFSDPLQVFPFFGSDQGWTDLHPRQLGDVNGDGCLDIVGFYEDAVKVAFGYRLSSGRCEGTFLPPINVTGLVVNGKTEFTHSAGWLARHPRWVVNVTDDRYHRADIIGLSDDGVVIATSLGSSNFSAPTVLTSLGVGGNKLFGAGLQAGRWW
jgi:hypothetical protein